MAPSKASNKAAAAQVPVTQKTLLVPPASQIIDAAFKEDDSTRQVFSAHLKARTAKSIPNALRARTAFVDFAPSRFGDQERQAGRYAAAGEDLPTTLTRIVKDGVDRIRGNANPSGIRIATGSAAKTLVTTDSSGKPQAISHAGLLDLLATRVLQPPARLEDPAFTACVANLQVQNRFDAIEGTAPAPATTGAGDGTAAASSGAKIADPKDFVAQQVQKLLANVPSPEEPPVLAAPAAADRGQVRQNIENFELRSGPSDVTSYHDFNNLQIAFEHVWTELFDQRMSDKGREIYQAYVELLDFVGNPVDPKTGQPITPPATVTSIDDIKALLQSASMLGQASGEAMPSGTTIGDLAQAFETVRQNLVNLVMVIPGMGVGTANAIINTELTPLKSQLDAAQADQNAALQNALPSVTRLATLLEEMRDLLSAPYAFTVYQEKACNFGIITTYRQKWQPENYQVGDLVKTIPLGPRQIRKYTTRQVTKRSRVFKEVANNLSSRRSDIDTTGRADRDIVDRAENRTNFKVTADGSFGVDADKIHATAEGGGDSAKISEATKKDFHEAVLKSAQEYRQENRTELETNTSEETETTTQDEIQNPNDELTVTYLFYELQRTYTISEQIHQVTPVVLVANKVPAPHELDDAWLIKNDWVLRRVLLDDSFRPALEYLTTSFVGDELTLQILDNNVKAQRQVVDAVRAQVAAQISIVQAAQSDLSTKMDIKGGLQLAEGYLQTVKNVFDPLHLTGQSATGTSEGADAIASYAEETLDRADREKARLMDQLGAATTALQAAVDKLAAAMTEHYNKVAGIDRLRIHVKENIIYYMQAIWNHEPPDQRYFRVFEIQVPVPVPVGGTATSLPLVPSGRPAVADVLFQRDTSHAKIPLPQIQIQWKPLVEIADLDNVLGYKGNYAIYGLRENNCLTLHMMQDYLELSDELTIRDPDDFANYTVDQLQELAACLFKSKKDVYTKYKDQIRQWMIDRLVSGRPEDDRIIVPTSALYIEALVGTHPLLEDFKLQHRAIDVKKAQGEVRRAELENIRLAARVLANLLDDPDIDKKIVVEGISAGVTVDPETP